MSILPPSPSEILSENGALAQKISGFSVRASQQEMAEAIADAIGNNDSLVCEAGTGTGKTFAYLIPALLSGKKIIVSTGTKNLQEQLFHRDLPTVRDALALPVTLALLKGRANYLCLQRLEQAQQENYLFPDKKTVKHLYDIQDWSGRTRTGDIAELSSISEKAKVWPSVTSTSDNCLGQKCPQFSECFVLKARRKANAADVLVVNHHLFFADMSLHDEGFGELLPGAEAIILDEAHQLAETAAQFFGNRFSHRQCTELCQDSLKAEREEAGDIEEVGGFNLAVEDALRAIRAAFATSPNKGAWSLVSEKAQMRTGLADLHTALSELCDYLESLSSRGKALEACYRRGLELQLGLADMTADIASENVAWYELSKRGFVLHLTPLDIAERFSQYIKQQQKSWIFTSATLAVGDNFQHFCQQLGLENTQTARWHSPFNFRESALLYVPPDLPEPRASNYTQALVEAAIPVLKTSQGRAFMLFTSYRALEEAETLLRMADLPYPLFVQNSMPRTRLLEQFRQHGNAILLGTSSFWEGVDVRGEALSCVIIDKLPFAPPDDPVMEARIRRLRENGGNPFMDYQLPQAVIMLKQGVGRLIRDVTDRGVLMIGDPRLISKQYGRTFLDSLPPMSKTRHLEVVQRFFALEKALMTKD